MFRQACLYSENLGEGIGVRGYRVKKNPILILKPLNIVIL